MGTIAQLVEQETFNLQVESSILSGPTERIHMKCTIAWNFKNKYYIITGSGNYIFSAKNVVLKKTDLTISEFFNKSGGGKFVGEFLIEDFMKGFENVIQTSNLR